MPRFTGDGTLYFGVYMDCCSIGTCPVFTKGFLPFLAEKMGLFSDLSCVKDHMAAKEILNGFQMVKIMKADLYQNL